MPRIVDPLPAIRADRDRELARIDHQLAQCPDRRTQRQLRRERRKVARRAL
jgi:hypothetical protein